MSEELKNSIICSTCGKDITLKTESCERILLIGVHSCIRNNDLNSLSSLRVHHCGKKDWKFEFGIQYDCWFPVAQEIAKSFSHCIVRRQINQFKDEILGWDISLGDQICKNPDQKNMILLPIQSNDLPQHTQLKFAVRAGLSLSQWPPWSPNDVCPLNLYELGKCHLDQEQKIQVDNRISNLLFVKYKKWIKVCNLEFYIKYIEKMKQHNNTLICPLFHILIKTMNFSRNIPHHLYPDSELTLCMGDITYSRMIQLDKQYGEDKLMQLELNEESFYFKK